MAIRSAEKVALQILRAAGFRTHVTPPRDVTAPYIRVNRVGGIMSNLVTDAAMLTVAAYAADPAEAANMANKAREALFAARTTMVGDAWVRWWKESAGPANFPDPTSKLTRYQFSGQLMIATNLD